MTREEWLLERKNGIGASDAAAILGMSPYMTNEQLWEIKTGRREQEDISAKSYVKFGTDAEKHLRELFALDYPQYLVEHEEYKIIHNPTHPFIFASPDGELTEWVDTGGTFQSLGKKGGLEIKTTEIFNPRQWDQWNDRIPDHYYTQVLHQLLATGWEYVWLKARIKHRRADVPCASIRHYLINRKDVVDDMDVLLQEEIKFWDCVKNDKRPACKLPAI